MYSLNLFFIASKSLSSSLFTSLFQFFGLTCISQGKVSQVSKSYILE